MKEIFKDIECYEGLYQVSNLGRVKSLGNGNSNNSKERILNPKKHNRGYLFVGLYKEGKLKNCKIHRLVAQAFISNPDNLPQVNHKDENKTNNSVENLEWCDAKYNNNYGTRIERISKQVKCLETETIYPSTWEASRQTGIAQESISRCCIGHRKTAGGYHWQYI